MIFNKLWKIAVVMVLLGIMFFGMFLVYIPWLLSSIPIEMIDQYEVKNIPPPEGALSFAINHGKAMYFYRSASSENLSFSYIIMLTFLVIMIAYSYMAHKYVKLKKLLSNTTS